MVIANGLIHVVAGSMLALGRAPRLSSFALAATLIPTTFGGHRFWEEADPQVRANQQTHFFKNVSMTGGLILAAVDTEGKPSVAWRAKRQARKAARPHPSKPIDSPRAESSDTRTALSCGPDKSATADAGRLAERDRHRNDAACRTLVGPVCLRTRRCDRVATGLEVDHEPGTPPGGAADTLRPWAGHCWHATPVLMIQALQSLGTQFDVNDDGGRRRARSAGPATVIADSPGR